MTDRCSALSERLQEGNGCLLMRNKGLKYILERKSDFERIDDMQSDVCDVSYGRFKLHYSTLLMMWGEGTPTETDTV